MSRPDVGVIEQGELCDVLELLNKLEVEFEHFSKMSLPTPRPEPAKLLVTTAASAAGMDYRRAPGRAADRPVWIALTDSDSRSQRRAVIQSGFDYIVRRPVHPKALRLLLERALYKGDEHRQRERVAVGYGVTFKTGLRSRPATLVDLSPTGCRLLTRHKVGRGHTLTVHFPPELAGGSAFSHAGVVARVGLGSAEGGERGEHALGIRFKRYEPDAVERMRGILNRLCTGPPTLSGDGPSTSSTLPVFGRLKPPEQPKPLKLPNPPKDPNDRRERRSVYEAEVGIFGLDNCVLMGRDLSRHGLRLDPHPALVPSAQIRLSLPANDGGDPVVVGARVARDDGERGVALHFEWVDDEARLGELVGSLPAIFAMKEDDDSTKRVVLTELVPNLLRRKRPVADDRLELENRTVRRAKAEAYVEYRSGMITGSGTVLDISATGLVLRVQEDGSVGDVGSGVRLEFSLEGRRFDLGGEIVRHTECGFAVRFLHISDCERDDLSTIVERLGWAEAE